MSGMFGEGHGGQYGQNEVMGGVVGEVGEGRERRAVGYEVRGHGMAADLVGS